MSMVRFDPFSLMRDLDRLFEQPGIRAMNTWMPRVDVFEKDNALVIRAEVPGVDPESIDVTVEGGALTIAGQRSFTKEEDLGGFHRKEIFEGEFKRTILLPEGLDTENISASTKNGILEIVVPKSPEVLPKKVKVAVES